MSATSLGSPLKAQLTKFSLAVSERLTRPQRKFVHQILYGIQATQDVKLSGIRRSLQEKVPLIKTEDRLSRNLGAPALRTHLLQRLAEMGSSRVSSRTVLCLDLSDVRKEYACKMQYLDRVRDGNSGEVYQGYWLCEVAVAAYFATTFLGQKMKLRLLTEKLLIVSACFFGIPLFCFYALAEGAGKCSRRGVRPLVPHFPTLGPCNSCTLGTDKKSGNSWGNYSLKLPPGCGSLSMS